ncbi:NADPH-dependent FMN reductase [Granulicoccus phenolivorans]|uniref:NADPH-dependent FMN reductase n=1 Tax=Granulicoccus phenolivorans TaxID=266854 RepID=UPI000411A06E|nr:NAD(P)H-dependent oxidoreductase [Granulicoccus phenolivorans]
MKIGIIVGSTRNGRAGESVGQWVAKQAAERTGAEYELVDLAAYNLPMFDEATHPMMANKKYASAEVQAWSDKIDQFDGYIFITPEYNHSVPAAFKNAVDSLGSEWVGKALSLVGYGAVGGVRAIEHWRQITANFSMAVTRAEVNLSLFTDFAEGVCTPAGMQDQQLGKVFDELEQLTGAILSVAGANANA